MAIVYGRGGKDCEDYEEDCKDERQRGSYQTEFKHNLVCQRFPMKSMTPFYLLLRSRKKSGQTREDKSLQFYFSNVLSQGPSKLLGSLPYKGNADDNHPDHNPLDAHKVVFESKISLKKNIFSLEFDCTVRNITNLDFSIYVSFCVSCCKEFN